MRTKNAKISTLLQTFCLLAATLGLCGHKKAAAQDLDPYSQLVQDSERHTRSRWVSNSTETGEKVSVREGAPVNLYSEDDARRESLWRAYRGTTLSPRRSPYEALIEEGSAQEEGKIDCDCGKDCKCPPLVCKAGHCKANYVAMFSATWCAPCQKMYPILRKLRKAGCIVYIYTLDTKEFKDLNLDSKFQIQAYPTFLFFDKGKETKRLIGFTKEKEFYKYLVKKEDQDLKKPQPNPTPDPDVYDDI